MKQNRKNMIATFALVGLLSCTAGAFASVNVAADGETDVVSTPLDGINVTMNESAAVRLGTVNGLRFTASIGAQDYATLEALEENDSGVTVSYGMLIAPRDYVDTTTLTTQSVFGYDPEQGEVETTYAWDVVHEDGTIEEYEGTKTKIVNLPYETLETQDENGNYVIKGSLVGIKDENFMREFVGLAYVSYSDGVSTIYRMANYYGNDVNNNSCSIVYVAQKALETNPEWKTQLEDLYLKDVASETVEYTVETYVGDQIVDSATETKTATLGTSVSVANEEVKTGYTLDTENSVLSGTAYANGRLVLKRVLKEDAAYQVTNGGFETGDLTGWTQVGENLGAVSDATNYWLNDPENAAGYSFNMDGTYMYSAYAKSSGDAAVGTLTSSPFTVGGSGWITFKLGGMKNNMYVDVVDGESNVILKRFYNGNWVDRTNGALSGCTLNAYKADISDLAGKEVYFRVSDNATADYGLLFLDSFNTLHYAEPSSDLFASAYVVDGLNTSAYELYNGGFETGNLDGWRRIGGIGNAVSDSEYWGGSFAKTDDYLFSSYASDSAEENKGTLASSLFTIGGSGWITFGIGGIKNPNYVYIEIMDVSNGLPIARYYNHDMVDCTLIYYKANLSAHIGKTVFINIVDNASGDYGLIFCDEFKTYYENESEITESYILATDHLYTIRNGGFETGDLTAWRITAGEAPGIVTNNADAWFGNPNNEDYYFAGFEIDGENRENKKGTLQSDYFMLGAKGWITFRLGGAPVANEDVCVRVVNATTGEVMGIFRNDNQVNGVMTLFKYQFNNETDTLCYIELYDHQADDNGIWRLLVVDSFVANASGEEGTLITNRI